MAARSVSDNSGANKVLKALDEFKKSCEEQFDNVNTVLSEQSEQQEKFEAQLVELRDHLDKSVSSVEQSLRQYMEAQFEELKQLQVKVIAEPAKQKAPAKPRATGARTATTRAARGTKFPAKAVWMNNQLKGHVEDYVDRLGLTFEEFEEMAMNSGVECKKSVATGEPTAAMKQTWYRTVLMKLLKDTTEDALPKAKEVLDELEERYSAEKAAADDKPAEVVEENTPEE